MPLIFKVDDEGVGRLLPDDPAAYQAMVGQLHDIAAAMDGSRTSLKKALRALKSLIGRDPSFLPAYNALTDITMQLNMETEDFDEAYEWAFKGVKQAFKTLPPDFAGHLDMGEIPDRAFIACHNNRLEALIEGREFGEALEATRRQLALDPEDMFGCADSLGELLIVTKDPEEAGRVLQGQVAGRPTANYSLAFLAFGRGEYAAAATLLRRGFVLAPYAADCLAERPPRPNVFWHQGPQAPDFPAEVAYGRLLGAELWGSAPEAWAFLRYLDGTGLCLGERARMVALSEKCFHAQNGEEMAAAEAEWHALLAAITDETSAPLVAKADDPVDGETLWPWEIYAKADDDPVRYGLDEEGFDYGDEGEEEEE